MPEIAVPDYATGEILRRWPDLGPAWLKAAPTEFAELCHRVGGRPVEIMHGRYSLVVAVETDHGDLVLRGSPDPAGPDQARVSAALADVGAAPTVHEVWTTDTGTWTFLDRVRPGRSLREVGISGITLADLVNGFAPLLDQPGAPGVPYIGDWLRDRLEDDHLTDLAPGYGIASDAERSTALAILSDLTASGEQMLCHGDMSSGNVLVGKARRLYLIDPRGVNGEAAYDAAVIGPKLATDGAHPFGIRRLATALGVDPSRTEGWAVVALAARV